MESKIPQVYSKNGQNVIQNYQKDEKLRKWYIFLRKKIINQIWPKDDLLL